MLSERELESSEVVANASMNRERGLTGVNSYERELGFSPLEFLIENRRNGGIVRWLDLCCGTGRALIEAAQVLRTNKTRAGFELIGVDLLSMFDDLADVADVRLVAASILEFSPDSPCDLVTCVHGLHYLGDKLAAIARAVSWLAPEALFAAHLDLSNLRYENGRPMSRAALKWLRSSGIEYDRRRHLLKCVGPRKFHLPFEFVGADDTAGPNFTCQPAVNSYYQANT